MEERHSNTQMELIAGRPPENLKNKEWKEIRRERLINSLNRINFQDGDIVSLDAGMYFKCFHTDRAETIKAQSAKLKAQSSNFLETGKLALKRAIEAAVPGNRVGHISLVIQETIEKAGFSAIRTLTGHGIGRDLEQAQYLFRVKLGRHGPV